MKKQAALFGLIVIMISMVSGFEGGSGTEQDPYQIADCQQLQDIQNDVSAYYELVEGVDCSSTAEWNSGNGFDPIGSDVSGFTGSLDGQGYEISNLFVSRRPSLRNAGGLFNNVGSGGQIQEIKFRNFSVSLTAQGETGLVVGSNFGVIERSSATGTIDGGDDVGGFAGANSGTIRNSYTLAETKGRLYVGGLVSSNSGDVINTFAAGPIVTEDTSNSGGLVASSTGSVQDSYWDEEVTGFPTGSGPGTALSTGAMTGENAESNMNFDFGNVWTTTNSYPAFPWEQGGSGTENDPYLVENCSDLQAMEEDLSAYYQLVNDIDCSNTQEWNGGAGFDPVGNSSNPFTGQLSGDTGYLINDLYIYRPSMDNVGLFGKIGSASKMNIVKLVGLEEVDITGGQNVGAIAGSSSHTLDTVITSYVKGNVSGDQNEEIGISPLNSVDVGGIIGESSGRIVNSYAWANVSEGSNVGGIAGSDSGDSITDVYYQGSTGGNPLVGTENGDPVRNSYWDRQVTGLKEIDVNHGGESLYTYEMTGIRPAAYMDSFNFGSPYSASVPSQWALRDQNGYPELKMIDGSGLDPDGDQPPGIPGSVYPNRMDEIVNRDTEISVETFHPQSESMDVNFYDGNGSFVGDYTSVTGTVSFTNWTGLETGTEYEWYVDVYDETPQNFNSSRWLGNYNFTTIYKPEKPSNPVPGNDTVNIPIDQSLGVDVYQEDGRTITNNLYISNNSEASREEFEIGGSIGIEGDGRAVFDPGPGNFSLNASTDYRWFVNSTFTTGTPSGSTTTYNRESEIWNFSTVERPEVIEPVTPENNSIGVGPNPVLNITVNGSAPINVSLNDYDKDTGPEFYSENNVDPGDSVSFDLSNYPEMGEGITERWYVELESNGATWNNSENPYNFKVSDISEVNYNILEFEQRDNLAPGLYGGLGDIVGDSTIGFQVSNPSGKEMDIEFNLTNSTTTEQVQRETDVGNNQVVYFDAAQSAMAEENSNYTVQAFYREGQNEFFRNNFTSDELEFTTFVTELNWTHDSPSNVNNYRVYYNETSTAGFNTYSPIGTTDGSNTEIGVANRNLSSDSNNDCYALRAINQFGESNFASTEGLNSNCLGGGKP